MSNYTLHFEPLPRSARINMRLPEQLIAALKVRALARGTPYLRLIREAPERAVAQDG